MSLLVEQELKIVPVMVGTAGHVDHGKTALVKLLTGCDTDCLPEEKKRGMSIDLGFAPCRISGSRMVGVIDVPGHEDFIKNMVAGASAIDVLMLVVAADDGIMPQTEEHLKIVSLLGSPQVMAVITKIDLATLQRREEVKEKVSAFLAANGFAHAPVIMMSNRTSEGLDDVRQAVDELVAKVQQAPVGRKAFRMDIERVFSPPGVGSVVTGIPLSGHCFIGDKLELFPGAVVTACRAVQKYGQDAADAEAHTCSAITIRDIKAADIERGMTLASPGIFKESTSVILSVRNVHPSFVLKRRQEMRFCCGTFTRVVSGLLLGSHALGPGETGFMQIESRIPMVVAAGDRYLLRTLSPASTVAGGVVLTRHIDPRRKKLYLTPERLERARQAAEAHDGFHSELIAGHFRVIDRAMLSGIAGCIERDVPEVVADKVDRGVLRLLGPSHWVINDRIGELEGELAGVLARYHQENKASRGMPGAQVCLALKLETSCLEGLREIFADSDQIIAEKNVFSLRGYVPELTAKQEIMKEVLMKAVRTAEHGAAPYAPIQAQLNASDTEMQFLVRLLAEEGSVVVVDHYLIAGTVVWGALEKLKKLFEKEPVIDLGGFRQVTGFSRNLAVPVLEFFDAKGITCREGKGRRLIKGVVK
ncbi:MAG: selenocysteine-specific translation elongation factor [Candidatus Omnitrophica bacterium]|nr:selenocysteine-specific translation elongation factor [Candidatus Omnitrophota bacterium]